MEEKMIKLSQEELDSIIQLRNSIRDNTAESGSLNIQKHFMQIELDILNAKLAEVYQKAEQLEAAEKQKIDEVVSKYGEGSSDFAAGICEGN